MKLFKTILAAFMALVLGVQAQNERILIPGVIIKPNSEFTNVYLLGSDKANVYYVQNPRQVNIQAERLVGVANVYIMEPPEFREAMALFEGRKYQQALTKFGEVKQKYDKFKLMPNNHFTLSGYYELECHRKLMDLDALAKSLKDFIWDPIKRADYLQQIEVYKFWDAARSKNWRRLDLMAKEWKKKRVPISIRAQIAYTHGMALEGMKQEQDALTAYATAMTADFGKSEVIVRQAALNSLRMFAARDEVKTAMQLWGTDDEDKTTDGYLALLEANGLARLYESAGLGAGVKLPAEYAKFLKFTPKEQEAAPKE
ncbi:hypothetical protein SAMN02745181_0773 [Rubritalea squalenifaciens DSM 18772]|uniref:HEAT repeat-containing protein n=1 Tax=Rubritalea squalenifaciens DSM 18772 TaxID=1123071 RepID=A0A1M6DL50_9BACT|nr:hypothetical protein [Rubritalea squalenifaciens]SHI73932.1 hypothetical protein SAMN02745181_0773 [Rubritalea squalenifaciens DSM 18772]